MKKILTLLILLLTINVYASDWEDLQKAFNNESITTEAFTINNNTITLNKDIICDNQTLGPIVIASGKEFILDLNGYKIDRNLVSSTTNGNVITLYGKLTIDDSVGAGSIKGGYNASSLPYGGGLTVNNSSAILTLNNGIIEDNHDTVAGAIHIHAGSFVMNGGIVRNNTGNPGSNVGGIYLDASTASFVMNGGEVSGNNSTNAGALYACNGAIITINDGTFKNNTTTASGALFFGYNGFTLTINGGTFEGNTSDADGGLIATARNGNINITGGTFKNNEAKVGNLITTKASGSYVVNVSITGGTFTNNTFKDSIVGLNANSKLTIGGTVNMTGNKANNIERNLYLPLSGTFNIENPTTMKVGVTLANNDNPFTNTLSNDYSNNFVSDLDEYLVIYESSKLKLNHCYLIEIPNNEGLLVTVHDDTLDKDLDSNLIDNKLIYKVLDNNNVTINLNTKTNYYFKDTQEDIIIENIDENKTITYSQIIKITNPQTGDNLIYNLIITISVLLTLIQLIIYKKRYI